MLPYTHVPSIDDLEAMQSTLESVSQQVTVLSDENAALKAHVQHLGRRISHLEAENAHLCSSVAGAPLAPARQSYTTGSDNAMHLPMVIERLAVMQDRFRRQGMLNKCSTVGCPRDAFDQNCFREGHMAWCRTHERIITRRYTTCSVKASERGDCLPVYWEDRGDWEIIVATAFKDGKIGHKNLHPEYLNKILFPPRFTHNVPQHMGPPLSHSVDQYHYGS